MNSELCNTGVWRRLAAMLYDGFLIFALLFIASLIPTLLFNAGDLGTSPATNSVVHELDSPLQGGWYQLYLLTWVGAFYLAFWRKNGQTLGMQAWKIKLVREDGEKPSYRDCLVRLLTGLLSIAAGGLGYWWIWLDKQNRSWHDITSHTRVVEVAQK